MRSESVPKIGAPKNWNNGYIAISTPSKMFLVASEVARGRMFEAGFRKSGARTGMITPTPTMSKNMTKNIEKIEVFFIAEVLNQEILLLSIFSQILHEHCRDLKCRGAHGVVEKYVYWSLSEIESV